MSVLDSTDVLDVAGYAAAVRRSLADLGPDQVDDLTDDLEADLADALADERHIAHGRGVLEQFGPPEEYAAELRAAAGLGPVVTEPGHRTLRDWLAAPFAAVRAGADRVLAKLREQPFWPPVESFLVALRPFWWIARAWVGYQAAMYVAGATTLRWLPRGLLMWVLLGTAIVLSVQWGRGVWFRSGALTWLARAANVFAVVALLPVLLYLQGQTQNWESAYNQSGYYQPTGTEVVYQDTPMDGVVVDGMQVSNLFAYDAEGNPLDDVQIFDDRGRPVRTTFDNGADQWYFPESNEPWSFVSRQDADGRSRWNVYPLQGAPTSEFTFADDGTHSLVVGSTASVPPRPFAKAPALEAPAQSSGAADSLPPTPDAGSTPAPTP